MLFSNKLLRFITTTFLLLSSSPVLASTYKARCLNEEGEFINCSVSVKVGQDRIKITFKNNQGSNVDIFSTQVSALFRREYTKEKRRSFLSSVLGAALSTLTSESISNLLGLSDGDLEEEHEQIGIVYFVKRPPAEVIREIRGEFTEEEDFDEEESAGDIDRELEDEDTKNVKSKLKRNTKPKQNIRIPKNAIIIDIGDKQDAFALRQELKATTELEFEEE